MSTPIEEMEPMAIYIDKPGRKIYGYYIKKDATSKKVYRKPCKLWVWLKAKLFKQIYIGLIG